MDLRPEITPEAQIIVEKLARAISTFDSAQSEILKAAEKNLSPQENTHVIGQMKSTLQIALATRLCHMTLGGLQMSDADINDCAINIVQQLQIAANDMRAEAQGPPPRH